MFGGSTELYIRDGKSRRGEGWGGRGGGMNWMGCKRVNIIKQRRSPHPPLWIIPF